MRGGGVVAPGAASSRGALRRKSTRGFSLVEMLVALVVLEIGVLGVLGLGALAARDVARAAELQRAVGLLEVAADSLLAVDDPTAGERAAGPHRVVWQPSGGELRLRVERTDDVGGIVTELALPLGP